MGVRDFTTPPRRLYLSHVIIRFDQSINKLLHHFKAISSKLTETYEEMYKRNVSFELATLNLNYDKMDVPQWFAPASFVIDRRIGKQYAENTFFCEAGLPTSKHLAALEALEKTLS